MKVEKATQVHQSSFLQKNLLLGVHEKEQIHIHISLYLNFLFIICAFPILLFSEYFFYSCLAFLLSTNTSLFYFIYVSGLCQFQQNFEFNFSYFMSSYSPFSPGFNTTSFFRLLLLSSYLFSLICFIFYHIYQLPAAF